MTSPPELNPVTGELWLGEVAFEALRSYVSETGATTPTATTEAGHHLGLLRQAGAFDGEGRLHPALSEATAAMATPSTGTLELSYGDKTMRGWAGAESAALLLPEGDDGRHKLTGVPLSWLPEALARLVDLSPRPRPEPARLLPYEHGMFDAVRRHWRLRFDWSPEGGAARGAAVEVVDTDGGLWVLSPDTRGTPTARPSTPATVWRLLVRLVTRRDAVPTSP